jgi:predicted O-linked N-acetylglucosamine transferase (SPINDLY family)
MTSQPLDAAQALLQSAMVHHQAGRLDQAETAYRQYLGKQPGDGNALHLLALILGQTARRGEAIALLTRALTLSPNQPAFHNNLGELYRQEGRPAEAIGSFQQTLALAPNLPEAHFNLANALKDQGQLDDAIAGYRRAVELRPNYAKAHYNLANTLRLTGRVPWAVESYQRVLELQPDWSDAHLNLGVARLELGNTAAALACFRRVQELAPDHSDIDGHLADAYLKQGKLPEAAKHYERVLERRPERWLLRLRLEILCEVIPSSNEAIDTYRSRLAQTLAQYRTAHPPINAAELTGSGTEPPVALAYQGRDDRPLMTAYAAVFHEAIQPPAPAPGTGKPHVAIVVTHGHEGVFARCLGGLVERLPPDKLRVSLVSSQAGVNVLRHLLPRCEREFLVIPDRVDQAAEQLRQANIDLVHYWEVGTDAQNYFLPFFRPAARQSACWGWPVTSGNPRIDYFVSSALLEPADGARHYTEQLVALASLPSYYERPPLPEPLRSRDHFGLKDTERVYLCVQNLRKYHPDFDAILAELLRSDPAGLLLLVADEQPTITEQLLLRLRGAMPDVAGRIRVLPRLERSDYLNLIAVADVVLDTLHYGGGANTVYDALAAGTPLVTLPGAHHRGRWAKAALARLELPDLVTASTAEYVRQALHVARDADYRRCLREQIQERSSVLFEDKNAVTEHAEFFLRVIEECRSSR